MDVAAGVAYCYPPDGSEPVIPIPSMTGYTAFSPDDTQILVEWIKKHSNPVKPVP